MRNPSRIKKILKILEIAWEENPDLRLSQMVYLAAHEQGFKGDIFNFEDDELAKGLVKTRFKSYKKD